MEDFSVFVKNSKLYLEGIYTHLATSGINDIYYDKQINKFKELTSNIDLSTIDIVHLNHLLWLQFCFYLQMGLL